MDEDIFAEQLRRAADDMARAPSATEPAAVVDLGIRRARLRTASLAASGVVVAIVLTLVAAQLVPAAQSGAPAPGSFATGAPPLEGSPSGEEHSPEPSRSPDEPPGTSPTPTPTPSGSAEPTPAASPTFPPQARCEPREPEVPKPVGIQVELSIDTTVLGPGETLRMDLVVRNVGVTPVDYETGGQRYDFWIEDRNGAVWLWSWGKAFPAPLIRESVAPGEEKTASETWDQSRCASYGDLIVPQGNSGRPPAGTYKAQAYWIAGEGGHGGWWSNEVEFVVV